MNSKFFNHIRSIWQIGRESPYAWPILILQIFSSIFSFVGLPMLIPVLNHLGGTQNTSQNKYLGVVETIFKKLGVEPSFFSILVVAFVMILLSNILLSISTLLAVYSLADLA